MTYTPNVLIVDDDPNAHFFAKRALRKSGGVNLFLQAYDGRQALQRLKDENAAGGPKVTHIVLDLEMPELDGPGFLREFEKLPEDTRRDVRIVVVTAAPKVYRERLEGVEGYISDIIDKVLQADDCRRVLGDHWVET